MEIKGKIKNISQLPDLLQMNPTIRSGPEPFQIEVVEDNPDC